MQFSKGCASSRAQDEGGVWVRTGRQPLGQVAPLVLVSTA
jgi:hypothetical protein